MNIHQAINLEHHSEGGQYNSITGETENIAIF